jgi:hypothetical protein
MMLNSDRDIAPVREPRDDKQIEGLPKTRKIERPQLVPRPLPRGWVRDNQDGRAHGFRRDGAVELYVLALADYTIATIAMMPVGRFSSPLEEQEAALRDVLDLLAWLRHERAVSEQAGRLCGGQR